MQRYAGTENALDAGRGRVLVMDDEPAVRNVIGAMLTRGGYEIEFARNGEEAIERYRTAMTEHRRFDVVVLDLTVRDGMGGVEAVRRLGDLDTAVRAIVVSGYSSDPVMARYTEYGFRGCVMKPFSPKELTRVVARVLAQPDHTLSTERDPIGPRREET